MSTVREAGHNGTAIGISLITLLLWAAILASMATPPQAWYNAFHADQQTVEPYIALE